MKLNKIIVAFDSFKGSLSSSDANECCRRAIEEYSPETEIISFPFGDGGEGTKEIFKKNGYSVTRNVIVHDPLMRVMETSYFTTPEGKNAYIESASVCGLELLRENERSITETTSYGLGELIRDAVSRGCKKIKIGLGGTAVNDGGTGMLKALGCRFLDKEGKELAGKGENLIKIKRIDTTGLISGIKDMVIEGLCDVSNPLTGVDGATFIFGPQKGGKGNELLQIEEGMKNYSDMVEKMTGENLAFHPGAGAAGGLGFSIITFFNGTLSSGAEAILELLNFSKQLEGSDLVVTGEGRADSQTIRGKAMSAILTKSREKNIPVIALAGGVNDLNVLNREGFLAVFSILQSCVSLQEAMKAEIAGANLYATMAQILRILKFMK